VVDFFSLRAIKPKRGGDVDREISEELAVGTVGRVEVSEAGVEAALERSAGLLEAGLCHGVVKLEKLEADNVALVRIELVGSIGERAVNTDLHKVSGAGGSR